PRARRIRSCRCLADSCHPRPGGLWLQVALRYPAATKSVQGIDIGIENRAIGTVGKHLAGAIDKPAALAGLIEEPQPVASSQSWHGAGIARHQGDPLQYRIETIKQRETRRIALIGTGACLLPTLVYAFKFLQRAAQATLQQQQPH